VKYQSTKDWYSHLPYETASILLSLFGRTALVGLSKKKVRELCHAVENLTDRVKILSSIRDTCPLRDLPEPEVPNMNKPLPFWVKYTLDRCKDPSSVNAKISQGSINGENYVDFIATPDLYIKLWSGIKVEEVAAPKDLDILTKLGLSEKTAKKFCQNPQKLPDFSSLPGLMVDLKVSKKQLPFILGRIRKSGVDLVIKQVNQLAKSKDLSKLPPSCFKNNLVLKPNIKKHLKDTKQFNEKILNLIANNGVFSGYEGENKPKSPTKNKKTKGPKQGSNPKQDSGSGRTGKVKGGDNLEQAILKVLQKFQGQTMGFPSSYGGFYPPRMF
jgi:hypothetical protein